MTIFQILFIIFLVLLALSLFGVLGILWWQVCIIYLTANAAVAALPPR